MYVDHELWESTICPMYEKLKIRYFNHVVKAGPTVYTALNAVIYLAQCTLHAIFIFIFRA